MVRLTVLSQALAVVRGDDDQRRVVQAALAQLVDHAAYQLVRVSHLAGVGVVGILRRERLGRIVRIVRVVEVKPQKEAFPAVGVEKAQRALDDLGTVPLFVERGPLRGILRAEFVVVTVEALVQAPHVVEHERADDGPGAIPVISQHLGEGRGLVAQVEAAVVAHAVIRRDRAGHQRSVGRKRQRNGGDRVCEPYAVPGERVHPGCPDVRLTVDTEVVRAGRVERDQQDVRSRVAMQIVARRAGKGAGAHTQREDGDDKSESSHVRDYTASAAAGTEFAQAFEGVDAGLVAVGPADADRVVADRERLDHVDVLRDAIVLQHLPSRHLVHALRAGAGATKVVTGIVGLVAVVPHHSQLAVGKRVHAHRARSTRRSCLHGLRSVRRLDVLAVLGGRTSTACRAAS